MDTDEPQIYQFSTPQSSNSFKRPRRSLQSSTPLSSVSESVTPSPRVSGQFNFNPQVVDHINALKHLDDHQILLLLQAARNGGQYTRDAVGAYAHPLPDGMRPSGADRSSMSTLGSRASSYLSVPSHGPRSHRPTPLSPTIAPLHHVCPPPRPDSRHSRRPRHPRRRTSRAHFVTRRLSQSHTGSHMRRSSTSRGLHGAVRTVSRYSMPESASVNTTRSFMYVLSTAKSYPTSLRCKWLIMSRAASIANNLGRAASQPAEKHRRVSRSMRS
jgi:hypothetical protein